jgi:hypothetical protein
VDEGKEKRGRSSIYRTFRLIEVTTIREREEKR